jgi:hypothetical protein
LRGVENENDGLVRGEHNGGCSLGHYGVGYIPGVRDVDHCGRGKGEKERIDEKSVIDGEGEGSRLTAEVEPKNEVFLGDALAVGEKDVSMMGG